LIEFRIIFLFNFLVKSFLLAFVAFLEFLSIPLLFIFILVDVFFLVVVFLLTLIFLLFTFFTFFSFVLFLSRILLLHHFLHHLLLFCIQLPFLL
jgi:hypothetical protein